MHLLVVTADNGDRTGRDPRRKFAQALIHSLKVARCGAIESTFARAQMLLTRSGKVSSSDVSRKNFTIPLLVSRI